MIGSSPVLVHLDQMTLTLVGQPDSLGAYCIAVLVTIAMHFPSSLDDPLLLLLQGRLVILGKVDDLPVLLINYCKG